MAKRTPEVDGLYESGDVYPDYYPDIVMDEIKKYHRIANSQKIPKRRLHLEIRRMSDYSTKLNKWLSTDTLSPRFVSHLRKIMVVKRMMTGFDEFTHLWHVYRDIIGWDQGGVFLDID
jgi:hypothetical protein